MLECGMHYNRQQLVFNEIKYPFKIQIYVCRSKIKTRNYIETTTYYDIDIIVR